MNLWEEKGGNDYASGGRRDDAVIWTDYAGITDSIADRGIVWDRGAYGAYL